MGLMDRLDTMSPADPGVRMSDMLRSSDHRPSHGPLERLDRAITNAGSE
jgi:hypothetical protein